MGGGGEGIREYRKKIVRWDRVVGGLHCKKQVSDIPPSPAGMSLTKLSLGGNKDRV